MAQEQNLKGLVVMLPDVRRPAVPRIEFHYAFNMNDPEGVSCDFGLTITRPVFMVLIGVT
jgi:hypothetical protein